MENILRIFLYANFCDTYKLSYNTIVTLPYIRMTNKKEEENTGHFSKEK